MPLNMQALEKAQEELAKKGGSKGWIQLSKIDKVIDVRIQDPLPAMSGLYFQEVPVWWVNNVKIVSPKLLGPGEFDVVKSIIDEAKAAKNKDILALLNAKSADGNPKISYKPEWWIPILKFNWDLDSNNNIKGIKNDKGEYDTSMIMKYIEDGRWKFLVVGIMALKAINNIATTRGGSMMADREKGFNLIITKAGAKKDTKYSAVKDLEVMPMPPELYTEDKLIDPYLVAQSSIYTKEYMEAVICKYLYNDCEIPEKSEDNYAYPDIRAELKAKLSYDEAEESKPTARPRPGRGVAPAVEEPKVVVTDATPAAQVSAGRTRTAVTTPAPARSGRPAATTGRPAGRPSRNVAEDLKEIN